MIDLDKELEKLIEKKALLASGIFDENYAELAVMCTGKKLNLGSLEKLGEIIEAFKKTGIPFSISVNELLFPESGITLSNLLSISLILDSIE